MQLLLTGGTGFFGRALLRHWLSEAGNGQSIPEITLLTRSCDSFLNQYPEFSGLPWLHFIQGDILCPESLPREYSFSHVLHAAADSTLGPNLQPLQRFEQIVEGTRNMLDFALNCGAKRFLLTSSGAVYGAQPCDMERIPEHYNGIPDPLNPRNAYGIAKRTAEHLCALYQDTYGIEGIIARCFAFVGQDLPLNVHFAIGNFIRDALWHDAINVAGNGMPVRSYLDQQDLAIWLLTLLEKGQAGAAYNVGSDEAVTIAELAYLVRDTLAPNKPVYIQGQPGADHNNRNRYVPDVAKIKGELGLQVSVSLVEAIKRTAEKAILEKRK
jgi:dTDP-glucose 4,6-dehydratase